MLALLSAGCVILGKSLNLSEPQFPHCRRRLVRSCSFEDHEVEGKILCIHALCVLGGGRVSSGLI